MPNHFDVTQVYGNKNSKPNKTLALLLANLRCKLLQKVLPLVKMGGEGDEKFLPGLKAELGLLYKRE